MAAASTDKLRKWSRKWVGQIGAGGVSDSSVATIPLSSTTNLPADTGVTLVIDRVDSAGALTPATEETIVGVVSGSNMVTCVRGVEGTAQAHSAGAVVELLSTATEHNDLIDAFLVGHGQSGAHASSIATLTGSQTLTNKTLTTPVINGQITGTMLPPLTSYANLNAPQGFLINGKIVPSVASNNLTVAIKGLDGNDPSASNPVYCRIGDTVYSITSALSKTTNAGNNYFNMGGAELATKEVDLFVYLMHSAVDNTVVLLMSRIAHARIWSDFVADTSEKGVIWSANLQTATASDPVEVIGRFAATLSAGAGYTWSVPTFTTANLIQRPIYETRDLVYVPQEVGWSGSPTIGGNFYKVISNKVFFGFNVSGTSDSTTTTLTIPFATKYEYSRANGYAADNGTYLVGGSRANTTATSSTLTITKDMVNAAYTASGTKTVFHQGDYLI